MGWTIAAVVVDDATGSILIDRSAAGPEDGAAAPRLPTVELPDGDPAAELAVDRIEELLGRPVVPFWMHYEEADDELVAGVGAVMVVGGPGDAGAARELVPAARVVDTLEPELARRYIRAWLDRLGGHADSRTQPWLDPAWHPRVSQWIAERMGGAGLPPTGPTRTFYQSPIGIVLRTPAAGRDVYLKCPAPIFHAEATITRALAARTPGWVPDVIDVEPAEGWLLMADLGNRQLGNEPESAWAEGLRRLGELQRAWVGNGDELLAAGAQHRPIAVLRDAVPGLLDLDRFGERLDPAMLARWPSLQPRLADACTRLEDMGLPDALIHGDAHPWNVAVTTHGPAFFDWSDGAIGPSFVDLPVFLFRVKDPALRPDLLDAYLGPWAGAAPRDRLERAAELAMAVGALYQVMTYLTLLPGLPPEDQVSWAGADAHWLRNAAEALDRGLHAADQRDAGP